MRKIIFSTLLLTCISICFASCGKNSDTETSVTPVVRNNVSKEIITTRPVQTLSDLDEEVYTVQTMSELYKQENKRSFQDYHVLGVTPPVR